MEVIFPKLALRSLFAHDIIAIIIPHVKILDSGWSRAMD